MSDATDQDLNPEELEQVTNTEAPEAEDQVDQEGKEVSDATEEKSEDARKEEESLSRRQRAELRRQAELKALMDKVAFLEKLAVNGNPAANAVKDDAEEGPKLEDYDGRGLNEYLADYNKHLEGKLVRKAQEEAKIAIARERQMAQLDGRVREVRKELTDWDEVMSQAEEDGIQVQQDTAAFIAESDAGPRIAYYLAKHPDEHEKINALSPMKRIAQLSKLEDKLATKQESAPVTKKVTNAPAKLSTAQGKPALANLDPAAAARQGYAAWKAADEARKAQKPAIKKR